MPADLPPQPRKSSFPVWAIVLIVIAALAIPAMGVFAALGIYGFRRYLAAAKQAEARNNVMAIARSASAAFSMETLDASGAPGYRLCPSASVSVPSSALMIAGRKYMSMPSDWEVDAASRAGFACLRFKMSEPQYYMYSYAASGPGKAGDKITAKAQGDLDGDGDLSTFMVEGTVSAPGSLTLSSSIFEDQGDE